MIKLYDIRAEYDSAMAYAREVAEQNEGVLPDDLSDMLDGLAEDMESKVLNCGAMYKNALASAEAIDSEIKRLTARKKALTGEAEWLKGYIERHALPGVKYETAMCSIGWRKSQETVIDDMALVPQEYCRIKIEPTKSEIKKAILAGGEVPGARVVNKNSIQIK
jgi:hypothetical protein